MNILLTVSPELSDFVKLDRDAALIEPDKSQDVLMTFYGTKL